ncbi:uncharacterized protein LOC131332680 [Rhododendron vialii]|uniref:uncharacterized protein LOC131332680 n=1 Tax=Rhododendron vialii TaxID=182163 RepID=UPI00265FECF4|nr:uncharacterized protein LOC131332680 [Rhododendron vialii]
MKLSVKVQDQPHHDPNHHDRINNPFLLRAKLPITVFGLPFLSGVSTSDPSDLSLSLRTNFPSGPSLKLSYTPTTATATATSPLSLTLKSGVSLFGSPTNSPLVVSAHFIISPQNPNPSTPTFSLQIKPQFGDFSLRKTTHSSPPRNPSPSSKPDAEVTSMGFVPLERPSAWKDLSLDDLSPGKDSLLSGIAVAARTRLPVTSRVAVSCRWGVNFPADVTKKMPFLTVSKIGIERVDEVKEVKEVEVRNGNGNEGDFEILKGLCLSVGRELEVLQRENREMKQSLEEMRFGKLRGQQGWSYEGYGDGVAKKVPVGSGSSGGFEQWKNKKGGGEEHGQKESKKNGNRASDVESELQRAIKAASS